MSRFNQFRKSLAEILMPKRVTTQEPNFTMLSGYRPVYTSFEGSVYEMDLTRACIHSFATHFSKFEAHVEGSAPGLSKLERTLRTQPNAIQDGTKFLYMIATYLMVHNTVVIVPIEDPLTDAVTGYFPLSPEYTEVAEYNGELYVIYQWPTGEKTSIELERCGIMTQMQLNDPFYGEGNTALSSTLELLHAQNVGHVEGIKNAPAIRFMAQLANVAPDKMLKAEQKRFRDQNFNSEAGGIMLFDEKYLKVEQVKGDHYKVDAEQAEMIQENVYTYFGTNKAILQNSFNNTQWIAYYEGRLEAPMIQLGNVLTNMTFSARQKSHDNRIMFQLDQSQYQTPEQKLDRATRLFDRGAMTINEVKALFNLPLSDEPMADEYFIRGEYISLGQVGHKGVDTDPVSEVTGSDTEVSENEEVEEDDSAEAE